MRTREIWKPLKECSEYHISNFGRVKCYRWNKRSGIRLRLTLNKTSGKLCFGTNEHGRVRTYNLAVTVARYFIPNPDKHKCVGFIDGNKTNCRVNNLKWITFSESQDRRVLRGPYKKGEEHGRFGKKLSKKSRAKVRRANLGRKHVFGIYEVNGVRYESSIKAAEALGVAPATIQHRVKHKKPGYIFYQKQE